jgi:hypothetical protein
MANNIPGKALLEAVANFRASYAAMLLSFDEETTLDAMGSWVRAEGYRMIGRYEEADDIQTVLEIGFGFLVARRAIQPTRPFSVLGQRQFDALKTISGGKPAEQSAPIDPMGELLVDNANLPASEFKTKWLLDPARRVIYERAITRGRV